MAESGGAVAIPPVVVDRTAGRIGDITCVL